MPGEANVPQPEILVFDRETKAVTRIKAEKYKDQSVSVAAAPVVERHAGQALLHPHQPRPEKGRRVPGCSGHRRVQVLIEERLSTYLETKPLRLADGGQSLVFWSERTGWGHFYLYDAGTGALKNAITGGEFVTTGVDGIDDKARVLFFAAVGREPDEDRYYRRTEP